MSFLLSVSVDESDDAPMNVSFLLSVSVDESDDTSINVCPYCLCL